MHDAYIAKLQHSQLCKEKRARAHVSYITCSFEKMAGVGRLRKFSFCSVIAIILAVLIVMPVTGEEEEGLETPELTGSMDATSQNVVYDVDGEVDIEDVEDDFRERRRAYLAYKTLPTQSHIKSRTNGQVKQYSPDTAIATVYGQSVQSDTEENEENSLKGKGKPVKVKVSCLGAIPFTVSQSSTLFNSSSSDFNFLMSISRNAPKTVEIVNTTTLLHDVLFINPSIKSRSNPSNCSVILFYARWCPFSAKAAPHFNALPRAFPSVRVAAVDSSVHPTVNTYFGILSVPTVILFHNGKIIAKFNDTLFTLNRFADFIQTFSDLKSTEKINVTSQDFHGPLPSSAIKEIDYYLYIAWVFITICFVHYVSKSSVWNKVMDLVRTTWREAEAHHQHDD